MFRLRCVVVNKPATMLEARLEQYGVNVDMSKTCPRCGKVGVCPCGVCALCGVVEYLQRPLADKGSAGLLTTTGQGMPAGEASK